MLKTITALAFLVCSPAILAQTNGVVTIPSHHSVSESTDRLASLVAEKGMKVFARIDFALDAEAVGLTMRPAQLLIFGNPIAGTPLIIASPTTAIDLPLKMLAWEDAEGKVHLSYNDPAYLGERHDIPEELIKNIRGIEALVRRAAE